MVSPKPFFSSLFSSVAPAATPLPSGPCPSTAHPPRLDEEAVSAEYSFDPCPSTAHPPKCDEEAVSVESVGDEDEEQAYQKKLPRYPHGLVLCPRQIVVSRVENLLLSHSWRRRMRGCCAFWVVSCMLVSTELSTSIFQGERKSLPKAGFEPTTS